METVGAVLRWKERERDIRNLEKNIFWSWIFVCMYVCDYGTNRNNFEPLWVKPTPGDEIPHPLQRLVWQQPWPWLCTSNDSIIDLGLRNDIVESPLQARLGASHGPVCKRCVHTARSDKQASCPLMPVGSTNICYFTICLVLTVDNFEENTTDSVIFFPQK